MLSLMPWFLYFHGSKTMTTMFNRHDISRDACQLFGVQAHKGYDWWWHSFTGYDVESGEAKPFFI